MARAGLSLAIQQSIIALFLVGTKQQEIKRQCKVSLPTIGRVISQYKAKAEAKATEDLQIDFQNWRDELKNRAVKCLLLALDHSAKDYDKYKAAPIAKDALRGLGELSDDKPTIGITIQLAPPGAFASAYRPGIQVNTVEYKQINPPIRGDSATPVLPQQCADTVST
jgi:hypothetical protein